MPQVFSRAADTYLRLALLFVAVAVGSGLLVASGIVCSDWYTGVGLAPAQPVPFSHRHHAGQLGIDCRYCHTTVEVAASAGYPPTHICMTCHSQIWTGAEILAPMRQSPADGRPLRWARVHDLPDFVYFDHSVHVAKGVGCVTCHAQVDQMDQTYKAETLQMQWCLSCHRNPAAFIRPPSEVFNLDWQPPDDWEDRARRLVLELGIDVPHLDHCYVCHR